MRHLGLGTILTISAATVALVATAGSSARAAGLPPACATVASCAFATAGALPDDAFGDGVTFAASDSGGTLVAPFAGESPADAPDASSPAIPVLAYAARAVRTFVDAADDAAANDAAIVASVTGAPVPYAAFGAVDAPFHAAAVTRRPAVLPTTLPRF